MMICPADTHKGDKILSAVDSTRKRQQLAAAVIAFLPIAADWVYKVFLSPRPFWAFFYDPETIHFHISLQLLSGQSPESNHNPGTPLQMLGALIALMTGRSPLDIDSFRLAGYIVTFGLILVSVFFLIKTFAPDQPLAIKVSLVWMFYLAPKSFLYLNIWSPELLYLPFGALALIAVWRAFSCPPSPVKAVLAGAAVGLCISVKFTFLAWAPAVLIASAFRAKRESHPLKGRIFPAAAGIVTGFVIGTLPILSRYPSQFNWLVKVATHSGSYGEGNQSLPTLWELMVNTYKLIVPALDWHFCVLAVMLGVVIVIVKRGESLDQGTRAMALFAIIAHISTFLLVLTARNVSLRYLLPAGLTGLVLFALATMNMPQSRRRSLALPVFLIIGTIVVKNLLTDMKMNDRLIEGQRALRQRIEASLYRHDPAWRDLTVVFGWRLPEPSFALRINTGRESDQQLISARYPHEGHVDWEGKIHLPEGAPRWDYSVLRSENASLVVPSAGRIVDQVDGYSIIEATARSNK